GFQPSYQTEGKIFARYVLDQLPKGKIGILFQNDDYGKDYVTGLKIGLGEQAKTMIVKEVSYEPSDPTVDSQISDLKASGADILYDVSIAKFSAMAIRKVYDLGWKPTHLLNGVSVSVSTVMRPAGFDKSKDVI